MNEIYRAIIASESVKQGLAFIKEDHFQTIADQREICEVPAPPFEEGVRAVEYLNRLKSLGLQNVQMDSEGNVLGFRLGGGEGPKLMVAAHLDTVFPAGTDTAVTEKDGKLYAPGIGDNARGLAAILSIIRAISRMDLSIIGDIIFCGNVGEEGLGDLRGIKALFRDHKDIAGFISLDGVGSKNIIYLATGSRRLEIIYKGPGGHSFSAFGLPSAIHALGRAVAQIADIRTPDEPKTTFTVGVIKGGTSINSIANEATMLVDIRSNDPTELRKVEERILEIAKQAAVTENNRWGSDQIRVEVKLVGDRPAGVQSVNSPIVQAAWTATQCVGEVPILCSASSTDANLPISLKIPAITLGPGGNSGGSHSLDEWFDPTDAYKGPQRALLTILGLVGIEGVCQPLLRKR